MKSGFIKLLIGVFVIGALYCIGVIAFGQPNDETFKVIETLGTVFLYSILGLICASVEDSHNKVAKIGVALCTICCIFCMLIEWEVITFYGMDIDHANLILKLFILMALGAFSTTHICVLLANDSYKYPEVKNLTIILSLVLDAIVVYVVLFESTDVSVKFVLILMTLIATGTIIAPLLHRLESDYTHDKTKPKSEQQPESVPETNNEEK